tara:strand:+ start:1140 stop:1298 length:159 start_codon:yes stop_codon:yes gene_type:complete
MENLTQTQRKEAIQRLTTQLVYAREEEEVHMLVDAILMHQKDIIIINEIYLN